MRWLLGNTTVMLLLAALIACAGLLIGYAAHDFTWFARSRALVQAIGIALLSRVSLIGTDIQPHSISPDTGLSTLDREHYKQVDQPVPEWVLIDSKTRFAVGVCGPFVSFTGTFIWAFGDLLNHL